MKTGKIIIGAVAVLVGMSVVSSRAQTLDLSGGTIEGDLTNQTLVDSANGNNDGKISSWVVSDSSVDSQGLIFIYQLENSGTDSITGLSFNNFKGSLASTPTSGSYSNIIGSATLLPTAIAPVDGNGGFAFDTVTSGGAATFQLGDLADGGTMSFFVVVFSDVDSFADGYALTQDDFQAHGDILAPIEAIYPVPEPSSAILLTGGILCFYLMLRCRRAMS
ncbi:MAG TPA: PEP-CTERM sorting domain-containing protein [Candidatus Sulfotelmatobacter sp.]|nr:PEP-CTERM sorting domain-containing protein [Candidatus Sulfotelmatobacter sp.]